MKHILTCLILSLGVLTSCAQQQKGKINSVEVGTVKWMRDHDKALAKSKADNKPVFLFFQEVPG